MYIRDANRGYVLVKMTWFVMFCSVDVGEALGLSEALQWVAELGFESMDFLLNLKLIIDFVNSNNA